MPHFSNTDQLDYHEAKTWLKPRPKDAHKGLFGHIVVVGGDAGMPGAVRMAGEAALRAGAGLVTIATHPSHATVVNMTRPELMCYGIESAERLTTVLQRASMLIIGPGLGQSDWSQLCFNTTLAANLPMVVDADGLNLLAQSPQYRDDWILTPHSGEAGRLLAKSAQEVQADRVGAINNLKQQYGGITVLKGAGSLVIDEESRITVCRDGNPGMASGGMGDVLSGVIAGLAAQGLRLSKAARLGVCVHARSADLVAEQWGERGLIATDLMKYIQTLVN